MSRHQRNALSALLVLGLAAAGLAAPAFKDQRRLADSMESKIALVRDNGAQDKPAKKTTVFTQDEVNAYFAERRLKMPDGVRSVTFTLKKDQVDSISRIDFDEITRDRRTRNPLMYLFSGIHNVNVTAATSGAGPGMVHVEVETVVIDGVTVPRMALQFFIDHFVRPKYPNVRLDGDYKLASKMDSVVVTDGKGTVMQK